MPAASPPHNVADLDALPIRGVFRARGVQEHRVQRLAFVRVETLVPLVRGVVADVEHGRLSMPGRDEAYSRSSERQSATVSGFSIGCHMMHTRLSACECDRRPKEVRAVPGRIPQPHVSGE
jgi:hypothetical protein